MIKARRAFDHVGMAVPDLDQAVEFFVDALGFDVVITAGPYDDFGYVWPGDSGPSEARCVKRTSYWGRPSTWSYSNTPTALRKCRTRSRDRPTPGMASVPARGRHSRRQRGIGRTLGHAIHFGNHSRRGRPHGRTVVDLPAHRLGFGPRTHPVEPRTALRAQHGTADGAAAMGSRVT